MQTLDHLSKRGIQAGRAPGFPASLKYMGDQRDRGPWIQSLTYFLWAPPSFSFWVEAFFFPHRLGLVLAFSAVGGYHSVQIHSFFFFFQAWGLGRGLAGCGKEKLWLSKSRMKQWRRLCFRETELAGPSWEMLLNCAGPEMGLDTGRPDAHSALGSFWPLSSGESPGERATVSPLSP